MPGQHKTRRNPDTGRIEKIPADDPERTPPLPEAEDPFIAEQRAAEPPPLPGEPPPLPAEPPPLPEQEEEEEGGAASGAVAGAKLGKGFGPLGMAAGAAGGAAAGWLLSQASKPMEIGTLEGSNVQQQGDNTLQQLLDVTKQMARVGTPVKDAVTTKAEGSRM